MPETISHGWTTAEPDDPSKDVSQRNLNDHVVPAWIALPESTGVDDTSFIQAALTAARTAGGGVVKGLPGETYIITGPLVIGSKTVLDMTDCTINQAGSVTSMLKNYNNNGGGRDTDIRIVGGTWAETAGTNGDTHFLFFNQVDRLTIRELRITTLTGKYAISLSEVTAFAIEHITLDVNSDGVHVTGPASDGYIGNISGAAGDDLVALGCSDFTAYDISRGDITDITVEILRPLMTSGAGRAMVMFTTGDASYTTTMAMRRITIRDVKGRVQNAGVLISDVVNNVNAQMTDITISDISLVTPTGQGLIVLNSVVTMRGIHCENLHIPADAVDNQKAIWVMSNTDQITVAGIRSSGQTLRATGVYIDDNKTVGSIALSNVLMTAATNLSGVVTLGTNSVISDLSLLNIAVDGAGNGNVVFTSGGTAAVTRCNLVNVTYNGGAGGIFLHQSSTTPDVSFSNVRMLSGGVIFYLIGTGGMVIRGAGATAPTYWVYRSSTQVVNCYSTDIHVDVDLLTPTAGAMAFNTNGAHGCGVGPVVSEGTHWKGLYNGTAYP